jgi:hypothetical protein
MLANFSPEKNTHHLHVFHRKFNVFIENLTELPNFMVLDTVIISKKDMPEILKKRFIKCSQEMLRIEKCWE